MQIVRHLQKHTKSYEKSGPEKKLVHSLFYGLVGMTFFLIIWVVVGYFVFRRPGYEQFSGFMPLPAVNALFGLLFEKEFWVSVVASLRRIGVGILIAFLFGLPTGLLIGFYWKLRMITNTPFQFIRMISPLSWMPIALLLFNEFESAIYFLITMATVWPIIMNTSFGVSRVNPHWIKMALNQGATNRQLILHIVLPASIPYILTSLRLALGVAWIVLVPVEFLGISSGLGYIINDARDTLEYDRLMAVVLAIGIVGFLLDATIRQIRQLFRWTWVS